MNVPSIDQIGDYIVLSNDYATLQIAGVGAKSHSLMIKPLGETFLPEAFRPPFARVELLGPQPAKVIANAATYEGLETDEGKITIHFNTDEATPRSMTMTVRAKAESNHFLFELIAFDGPQDLIDSIGAAVFAALTIQGGEVAEMLAAVGRKGYMVAPIPLTQHTNGFHIKYGTPDPVYEIRTQSFRLFQLLNARTALLFFRKEECMQRMDELAVQYQLPRQLIGNQNHKLHPDVKRSYLFIDITRNNLTSVIPLAKRGHFLHIMPFATTWARTYPTYDMHPSNYLDDEGLKDVVDEVRANGMKFGLHVMSFLIQKEDAITQDGHAGIARETPVSLAQGIGTGIPQNDPSRFFIEIDANTDEDTLIQYEHYLNAGEKYIIIEQEIILCRDFLREANEQYTGPGFILEKRGALETTQVEHPITAQVWHLPEIFQTFLANPNSGLPDEIAARVGEIYNSAGVDFMFLDGADGQYRVIPKTPRGFLMDSGRWYIGAPFISQKFLQYLNRDVLLEGSAMNINTGFAWFLYARGGTGDYANIGVEDHLDFSRIGSWIERRFGKGCFPAELGWFGLLAKVAEKKRFNNSYASTTPDEIEFLMNRALGHDLPIGLETNMPEVEAHGRSKQLFGLIGTYERLRISNYFSDSYLQKLQYPDESFRTKFDLSKEQYRLVKHPIYGYGFRRQAYFEKVLDKTDHFDFVNPFPTQSLKVKITALPAVDESDCLELLDWDRLRVTRHPMGQGATEEGACRIESGNWITAFYSPTRPEVAHKVEWCRLYQPLSVDLSSHKVLKVSFHGCGTGEVVHIQLHDARGIPRYRLFEIIMNEENEGTGETFFYQPSVRGFYLNPPRWEGVLNFRNFDFTEVRGITIYVKNIRQGNAGIRFKLTSIKALKEDREALLQQPNLRIGNREITMPIDLQPYSGQELNAQPWEFAELNGNRLRKYNGNHQQQGRHRLWPYRLPKVKCGLNRLHYRHKGENKALVRILLEDGPVFDRLR